MQLPDLLGKQKRITRGLWLPHCGHKTFLYVQRNLAIAPACDAAIRNGALRTPKMDQKSEGCTRMRFKHIIVVVVGTSTRCAEVCAMSPANHTATETARSHQLFGERRITQRELDPKTW